MTEAAPSDMKPAKSQPQPKSRSAKGCLGFAIFVVLLVAIPLIAGKPKPDEQAVSASSEESVPSLHGTVAELERRAPSLTKAQKKETNEPKVWMTFYLSGNPAAGGEAKMMISGQQHPVITSVTTFVRFAANRPDTDTALRAASAHIEAMAMASGGNRDEIEAWVHDKLTWADQTLAEKLVGSVKLSCGWKPNPKGEWLLSLAAAPAR